MSCIAGRFFTAEPPRKYHSVILIYVSLMGNDVHLFICLLAVLISFFFLFWLFWVFVAVRGLSLDAVSGAAL